MHRLMRDRLEEVLAKSTPQGKQEEHLEACPQCRAEISAMRQQAAAIRELQAPASVKAEPPPGFYARVIDRIEAQNAVSIWSLFFDSPFGRRVAIASTALALVLGGYLITSERIADQFPGSSQTVQTIAGEDQAGSMLTQTSAPDRDAVLVNLVTYREQ